MEMQFQERAVPGSRRLCAGLGAAVLFGALFVLPLLSALALCTMPCCMQPSRTVRLAAPSLPCGTDCEVRAASGSVPLVRTAIAPSSPARVAAPALATTLILPPAVPRLIEADTGPPVTGQARLNVLNSVFRI